MRTVLFVATVVGFALTAWGIVEAYRGAVRAVRNSESRMKRRDELQAEWEAAVAAVPRGSADFAETVQAVNVRYARLYKSEGLLAPSIENADRLYVHEVQHVLREAVEGARSNLLWAGVGLLISTVASAGALFV